MTDREIANRIIKNFLKENPDKKALDFILENQSLRWTTCFNWTESPEGFNFWCSFYKDTMNRNDNLVINFLKTHYFNSHYNNFIDLRFIV